MKRPWSDADQYGVQELLHLLMMEGKWKTAETLARGLVELSPDDDYSHTALGVILRNTGNHQLAAESFRTALSTNPNSLEAAVGLGEVLVLLGQMAEARACYEMVTYLVEGLAVPAALRPRIDRLNRVVTRP